MSTRATITVRDDHDAFHIYRHHDGYPDSELGMVRQIADARALAMLDAKAADFGAALVATLKTGPGSTYLTADPDAHGDREYHYAIKHVRDGVIGSVSLVVEHYWRGDFSEELFRGSIDDAATHFDSFPPEPVNPESLSAVGGVLMRAAEEIHQLCGYRPDPDTEAVLAEIDSAAEQLAAFQKQAKPA